MLTFMSPLLVSTTLNPRLGVYEPHRLRELAGGGVADIRICFGGMAAIPKRARECEAALIGRPWSLETVREGQAALRRDYTPISDMRASRGYRALAAENLLLKFFHETGEGAALTRTRILQPAGPSHG